jgi:hypothetical protein
MKKTEQCDPEFNDISEDDVKIEESHSIEEDKRPMGCTCGERMFCVCWDVIGDGC